MIVLLAVIDGLDLCFKLSLNPYVGIYLHYKQIVLSVSLLCISQPDFSSRTLKVRLYDIMFFSDTSAF